MTLVPFPLPVPSIDNQYWFDKCKEHVLVLQQCKLCDQFNHPPRPNCAYCGSSNLHWIESTGRGTIYTFTVTRQPVSRPLLGRIPWVVVEVELNEGVHMISNLIDFQDDDLQIGMAVQVVFEQVDDDITLPKFELVA